MYEWWHIHNEDFFLHGLKFPFIFRPRWKLLNHASISFYLFGVNRTRCWIFWPYWNSDYIVYEIVNPKRKLPSAFFSRVGSLRVQVSLKEWRIFPQKRQLWVTIFARDETFKIDPLQLFHIFVRYVCCGDPASNILFKFWILTL